MKLLTKTLGVSLVCMIVTGVEPSGGTGAGHDQNRHELANAGGHDPRRHSDETGS